MSHKIAKDCEEAMCNGHIELVEELAEPDPAETIITTTADGEWV